MATEHPYSATLRAIADGETDFEVKYGDEWELYSVSQVLALIGGKYLAPPPEQIRVKPKTRTINGIVVPEPYFGPMEVGQIYYVPSVTAPDDTTTELEWENDATDTWHKQSGYVHLSEENAEAWSKAWRATCAPEAAIDVEAVEKPELEVGQKWLTVGGDEVTVQGYRQHAEYPFFVEKKDGFVYSVNPQGVALAPGSQRDNNLEKLIADVEAVKKPEIKVGQTWRTRGGYKVTVQEHHQHDPHPFVIKKEDGSRYSVNAQGYEYDPRSPSDNDLEKLIADVSKGGEV